MVILYRAIWGTTVEDNVAEVGIEPGNPGHLDTTLDAITTVPWSHILIELLPEVDHILKKYWLRISYNISYPNYITE